MTRNVTCTVVNYTSYNFTLLGSQPTDDNSNTGHGSFHTGPATTLTANSSVTAFVVQKTSGSAYGSTGYVRYDLKNGQGQLVFMFNNPFDRVGSGSNSNCWFYAVIEGANGGAIGTAPRFMVDTQGFTFNTCTPTVEDEMSITVSIRQI